VMDLALEQGALDCWFTPIQMKKNRPATMVSILCTLDKTAHMKELLYRETTTIGVRVQEVERECLDREIVEVRTSFGTVDVKVARRGGIIYNAMPEFEHVKRLAKEHNVPVRVVRDVAISEWKASELGSKAKGSH
ncbi:MAG: nickel insertion protein, partial [Pyrinomonadaceae bacterium]